MAKRKTTEQFIQDAEMVHGKGVIDYSMVEYENSHTPVTLRCIKHDHVFQMTPSNHLRGKGCSICGRERIAEKARMRLTGKRIEKIRNRNRLVYGIGINDANVIVNDGGKQITSYHVWQDILYRCHTEKGNTNCPSYVGCSICEEWKRFSVFKEWFDKNYIQGYYLDKDILEKGNKVYDPKHCVFVPQEINMLLCKANRIRGKYPIGVSYHNQCDKYVAKVTINNRIVHLGLFFNPEDAFNAYKQAKERHIKDVAQKYYNDGKISKRVYDALMRYEVEITD